MQKVFDYLFEHPELIASAVLFVLSLLTIFLKRKPKSIDEFLLCLGQVIEELPELVSKIESPGNGPCKRIAVIGECLKRFRVLYGCDLTDTEYNLVEERISLAIEAILDAPTKKKEK